MCIIFFKKIDNSRGKCIHFRLRKIHFKSHGPLRHSPRSLATRRKIHKPELEYLNFLLNERKSYSALKCSTNQIHRKLVRLFAETSPYCTYTIVVSAELQDCATAPLEIFRVPLHLVSSQHVSNSYFYG